MLSGCDLLLESERDIKTVLGPDETFGTIGSAPAPSEPFKRVGCLSEFVIILVRLVVIFRTSLSSHNQITHNTCFNIDS